MLIQGSNDPIVVTFDQSVANVPQLAASLWRRFNPASGPIKVWTREDMTINDDTAILPMTVEETAALSPGDVTLEVKGLTAGGSTIFWGSVVIPVLRRNDRVIDLQEEV